MKILNQNGILRFDTSILVGPRIQKVGSFTPGWYTNPGSSTKYSGGSGSWSSVTNAYDGTLSTDAIFQVLTGYGWIYWDFGSAMAMSNFRIYQDYGGQDWVDRIWVYGSNSGAFGGEETQVAYRTGYVSSGSWQELNFTTYGDGPASFRYWKMRGYRGVSNWWRLGETGWYTDPGLVLCNVPFGCKVDLIASGVSQENQTSNSYDKNHLQFTTASGIDTITISENDGTTPWITMPFTYTSGDVWAFRWY